MPHRTVVSLMRDVIKMSTAPRLSHEMHVISLISLEKAQLG